MGIYLDIWNNIDQKLWEMINLTARGIVAFLKEQGLNEGWNKILEDGKRQIISSLLSHHPLDEVAGRLEMSEEEIIRILQE